MTLASVEMAGMTSEPLYMERILKELPGGLELALRWRGFSGKRQLEKVAIWDAKQRTLGEKQQRSAQNEIAQQTKPKNDPRPPGLENQNPRLPQTQFRQPQQHNQNRTQFPRQNPPQGQGPPRGQYPRVPRDLTAPPRPRVDNETYRKLSPQEKEELSKKSGIRNTDLIQRTFEKTHLGKRGKILCRF